MKYWTEWVSIIIIISFIFAVGYVIGASNKAHDIRERYEEVYKDDGGDEGCYNQHYIITGDTTDYYYK